MLQALGIAILLSVSYPGLVERTRTMGVPVGCEDADRMCVPIASATPGWDQERGIRILEFKRRGTPNLGGSVPLDGSFAFTLKQSKWYPHWDGTYISIHKVKRECTVYVLTEASLHAWEEFLAKYNVSQDSTASLIVQADQATQVCVLREWETECLYEFNLPEEGESREVTPGTYEFLLTNRKNKATVMSSPFLIKQGFNFRATYEWKSGMWTAGSYRVERR